MENPSNPPKRFGIIREGKVPQDSRVPLNPLQCKALVEAHPEISLVVQPSPHRCFTDAEYEAAGIKLQEDMSDREVLLGVKEVPIPELLDDKVYLFFSHTIKKQPYNKKLLQTILAKRIQLIDWETLTNDKGQRVIAFGRWAGIVGAHNGLWTWGQRTGAFELKRAKDYKDYEELQTAYQGLSWPAIKIAVTGGGRVAMGSEELLKAAGIRKVSPEEYLSKTFDEAVFCRTDTDELYRRSSDRGYDKAEFYKDPSGYESTFIPFTQATDLFINAIFWNPAAPVFFSKADMREPDFRIKVVADITCDIEGSVPSTLYATTIADPVYGYDPVAEKAVEPYQENVIDTMSIDNLPNELPRDASEAFGRRFTEFVWPSLKELNKAEMINRATIARGGELNEPFHYLTDYVKD